MDPYDVKYDKESYRQARIELGMTRLNWITTLGISIDSHKSYSSGRLKVPTFVSNHIQTLKRLRNKELESLS